jgi:hypothetical protein
MKKQRWKAVLWRDIATKLDVELSAEWFDSEEEAVARWSKSSISRAYFITAVRID